MLKTPTPSSMCIGLTLFFRLYHVCLTVRSIIYTYIASTRWLIFVLLDRSKMIIWHRWRYTEYYRILKYSIIIYYFIYSSMYIYLLPKHIASLKYIHTIVIIINVVGVFSTIVCRYIIRSCGGSVISNNPRVRVEFHTRRGGRCIVYILYTPCRRDLAACSIGVDFAEFNRPIYI